MNRQFITLAQKVDNSIKIYKMLLTFHAKVTNCDCISLAMLYIGRSVTCGIGYLLTPSDIVSLIHRNQEVTPGSYTIK